MKLSKILSVIALILILCLSFAACKNDGKTEDTHLCPECGLCTDAECTDETHTDKCQGHTPAHTCEHVCEECGKCLDTECTDAACADKCQGHTPAHTCEHVCEECGKCLDTECTDAACADKCQGHTPAHTCTNPCDFCGKCDNDECADPVCAEKCECTTPTLTVDPPVFEIYAEDEVDLMVGVIVTDAGDEEPRVIITDDQGFDASVEGE